MSRPDSQQALIAATNFQLTGMLRDLSPYGSGHINDTYAVTMSERGQERRYVLQRINHHVFRQPDRLMENIERVCAHTQRKIAESAVGDARRRGLRLLPSRTGRGWHVDESGNHWRCYDFIENATGHDVVDSPRQAYEAARAFGLFQSMLTDLPGGRLHETIPDFHNTHARFRQFEAAVAKDPLGRTVECAAEIDFALGRARDVALISDALCQGEIPERITHNDTKLNNVLLDDLTGEGLCVIDLDTVMPGSALYDFGDLVRTSTSPAAEDETDLGKVTMRLPMFEALTQGYLAGTGAFLTPLEKELLPLAGRLITLEIGLRFLTDWLEGDTYFKVKRPTHNLDRARTQFRLVASIEEQLPAMRSIIARA